MMIDSTTPRSARSPRSIRTSVSVAGLALFTPLVLVACGGGVTPDFSSGSADAQNHTVSITNCGRELNFESTPTRIVGMMPSQTELLLRLGAQDHVVGQAQVDTSSLPEDVADKATNIPTISGDAPPSREDLLATSPDLVVSPTEYEFTAAQGYASIEQLSDNGAHAYVATGGCADRRNSAEVSDVFTDIRNLGKILAVSDTADKLVSEAEGRLSSISDAIKDHDKLSVAQVYVEGNTLGAIGAGVEADIIKKAGGANVFDPQSPEFNDFFAAEINAEEIVQRNPEAIVFGISSPSQEQQIRSYLRKTFPDVPAVQEDRLIAIPQSDLYPGTLGNIDAVETIAHKLYPDAF